MRCFTVTALILACAAGPAAAKAVSPSAAKNSFTSWGKAGVSLAEYRGDAIACGLEASATDLDGTDPAKALRIASKQMENDPAAGPVALQDPTQASGAAMDVLAMAGASPSVQQMIGPDRQIAKAGDIMKARLDRCLAGRGYHRFKLTGEQRHRLAKLPVGSDARHAYLHSLASNPDILAHQATN